MGGVGKNHQRGYLSAFLSIGGGQKGIDNCEVEGEREPRRTDLKEVHSKKGIDR